MLRVIKHLYGIPESDLYWYLTYLEHHGELLGMRSARADPCVLYDRDEEGLRGLVILQVDASFGAGTNAFLEKEDKTNEHFQSKPQNILGDRFTTFNGIRVQIRDDRSVYMNQKDKFDSLAIPTTKKEFSSTREKQQYIGVTTLPDICASTQLIAPGTEPTKEAEFKIICMTISLLHETSDTGINYVLLDLPTIHIMLMRDELFANARNSKIQMGFLVMLVDGKGTAKRVHYASRRCRRVTRSIMAAVLHARSEGFDATYVVKDMIEEVPGRHVPIYAYIDSKTVFEVVPKQGSTT